MSDPAEAGSASTPDELPRWWHSQPLGLWWLLPLGLAGAAWLLTQGELRHFGYAVGATLGFAALVRLLLPRDAVGGLMVRSRVWDVLVLLLLGAGAAGVSYTLNIPPG